jgi:hypothetical protein
MAPAGVCSPGFPLRGPTLEEGGGATGCVDAGVDVGVSIGADLDGGAEAGVMGGGRTASGVAAVDAPGGGAPLEGSVKLPQTFLELWYWTPMIVVKPWPQC